MEHFENYNIKGKVVYGAVGDKDGDCRFNIDSSPDYQYGQSLTSGLWGMVQLLRRKTITTPMYKLDSLIKEYGKNGDLILHIDIQGAEIETLTSADLEPVDYILIGTHKGSGEKVKILLAKDFNLIVDIKENELGKYGELMVKC